VQSEAPEAGFHSAGTPATSLESNQCISLDSTLFLLGAELAEYQHSTLIWKLVGLQCRKVTRRLVVAAACRRSKVG